MKKRLLSFVLAVSMLIPALAPVTANAATSTKVTIQSNIWQSTFNDKFASSAKLKDMASLTLQGKIAYVGKLDEVKKYSEQVNNKYGMHIMTWKAVERNESESYYKQFYNAKYKDITNDEISYKNKQSWWAYYIYPCKDWVKLANDKKNFWTLAKSAVAKAGVKNGMTDKAAVEKIAMWICKHTTYKEKCPATRYDGYLFTKGVGKCEDYSVAFWAMCKVSGIPCKYKSGTIKKGGGWHGWNRVQVNGTWYWIDVTWMDSKDNKFDKKYFLTKSLWTDRTLKNDVTLYILKPDFKDNPIK